VAKVGILGSLVWDLIYGRDPLAPPVEEWGGIAYAMAGLDASVAPGVSSENTFTTSACTIC
jgi:hypothetical protein